MVSASLPESLDNRMIQARNPPLLKSGLDDFLKREARPFRLIQNGLSLPDSIGSERHIRSDPDPGGAGSPGGLHRRLVPDVALAIRSRELDWPEEEPALPG